MSHPVLRQPARAWTRLWGSSAVRYLVVGGVAFLFDLLLLWIAHEVLRIPLAIASAIAFLASFVVTYTLQRVVAFASDARVAPSVVRYAVLVGFNTVATAGIVWGVDALGAGWVVGKVLAVVATTVWNYFIYRYWVFQAPQPPRSTTADV
ncbi:GtrA family protein [Microbacterium sp. No. 7]|uniref:GtrA family protein n=1 Tax=Microbacterium sp. No. 7 TaxID=1714373 RepID=UPI0006ECF901|nr:GtrA family protein [Microbacterium sp. No. 7]ALJ19395.1 hypothetical protein AOA12_05540 [Microbacterium sp. No. 7]